MQQAYRALRVVSEAQTIRIVLAPNPGELMLRELCTACISLNTESSVGIKAVVLDFSAGAHGSGVHAAHLDSSPSLPAVDAPLPNDAFVGAQFIAPSPSTASSKTARRAPAIIEAACAAVHAIAQPVLAVVRSTPSAATSMLMQNVDFILASHEATLVVANPRTPDGEDTLNGVQAARLGYVTWSVPAAEISKEMERILDMLREKSAAALRLTKASVRKGQPGQSDHLSRLDALKQVNALYLELLMQTEDAAEGLRAFLEKRKPTWKNR